MKDNFGRDIRYMRISITDRCNLRCKYCMPCGIPLVSMEQILKFEEIEEICRVAVSLGITRFKITGGEPLVRLGCADLIGKIKQIPGVEQVTLTTNGVLLSKYLDDLIENGLDAVNISLDTLEKEVYKEITGFDALDAVLEKCRNTTGIRDLEQAAEHLAANALYQIEVNHVSEVTFDADTVRNLLA